MKTITKNLNGITVGELITMLKDIPAETEIGVWCADVESTSIEVTTYDEMPADVDIIYPSW